MRVCFAITNLLLIAAWNTGGAIHADLVESFPGSGPFAAVGGPSGFDNPGWVVLGTPGSFVANSFGELVYQMGTASVGQDSLNRFGGQTAFSSLLEISNLLVPDSQSGIRFGIVDSANETALIVVQPRAGRMVADLQASLGIGNSLSGGTLDLGAAGDVERVTLRLDFAPDPDNGGGMFTALADVNETGNFLPVGLIDGSFYSVAASSNRQFSLNAFTVSGLPVSAQFDHFRFTTVPEPGTGGLLAAGGPLLALRRRRRR